MSLQLIIPDEPQAVKDQLARMEFITNKIILRLPDEHVIAVKDFVLPTDRDYKVKVKRCCSCFKQLQKAVEGTSEFDKKAVKVTEDVRVEVYPSSSTSASGRFGSQNPLV